METLQASRQLLEYVGLTNDAYVVITQWKIPRELIRFYFICILIMDSILQFLACEKMYASNIHASLLSLHVALSTLSGVAIYVNLVIKTNEILELFDYLKAIFDKRNFPVTFHLLCKIINIFKATLISWHKIVKTKRLVI